MADKNQNLPELDIASLERELQLQNEYGDRPVEAALGSAASAATFGLSDVAGTALGIMDPEAQREIRDRNEAAALAGTAAGIVGPALATGGTSLAAKGASAGFKAVSKAGLAAERAAAKALAPRVGQTATAIGSKLAGGAVEGALAGAGALASDVALDRKELSAEAVLADVGTGALLGGAVGGAFGAGQASVPGLKKVFGRGNEALKEAIDPTHNASKIITTTPAQNLKLKKVLGNTVDDLPDYITKDLQLGRLDSASQLIAKNDKVLQEAGEQIAAISQGLDEAVSSGRVAINRGQVYQPMLTKIDELIEKAAATPNINKGDLRTLRRYRQDVIEMGASEKPFSFKELETFRKNLQETAYHKGKALESFEAELANDLRSIAREGIDNIANLASTSEANLAAGLKAANKRAHIGLSIRPFLEEAAERQGRFTATDVATAMFFGIPVPIALETGTRVARNTALIANVAKQTEKLTTGISKSVDNFFKGVSSSKSAATTLSSRVLIDSGFSINPDTGKKAQNKQQAFDNVAKNVTRLQSNPDQLIELMAKRTMRIGNVDAGVAQAMQTSMANAVGFLAQKLPKPAVNPGVFQRPYAPSSLELAKFERYMQVIEKPLSVLQDLQQGTLTREHVEALKAVYPEIYTQMQNQVLQYITDGNQVPYNRKIQLSILLDIPGDSSLSPESVLQLQSSFGEQQQEQPVGADSGLDKLDIAGRELTAVESIQNR